MIKIDWIQLEYDLKEVLRYINALPYKEKQDNELFAFIARKALTRIDEIIAYHTRRGNQLEPNVILDSLYAEKIRDEVWNT